MNTFKAGVTKHAVVDSLVPGANSTRSCHSMITEDQTEVVTFLASPSTYDEAAVERIETHASIIFLAGSRAWKLKRAVRYDYLDFSRVERRKSMSEAELLINRRTAPGLYRRVVAVTRESDGSLALGGRGTQSSGSSKWRASIRKGFSIVRRRATPLMSDGREGPPLELRGLFEQFFLEAR